MKKTLFPLAFAAVALTTACSDNEIINQEPATPDSLKEAIEFSMSDGSETSATTRAVTHDKFSADTRIVMYMRSNKDKGTSDVRGNKTICQTTACTNGGTDHSDITFETANKRYWDDAFGRAGNISVYAVAIPGSTSTTVLNADNLKDNNTAVAVDNTWRTVADANPIDMTFAVTKTTQTETTWNNEDLCYSNNIQKTGKDGRTYYDWTNSKWVPDTHKGGEGNHGDGYLQFMIKPGDPANPGYFDKGHLKFYHALTRMTVTLVEDEGFDGNISTTADFNFTTTKMTSTHNIQLLNMYTSGKLNMKDGTWAKDEAANIDVMWGSTTAANGIYKAQMLPDYEFVKDATTNVMQFEIDENIYYITQAELFKALNDVTTNNDAEYGYDGTNNKFKMMQGKCYNFTIKVKKKQIEAITATIVAWDDVTAGNFDIDNSHIKFDLLTATGDNCTDIKFLRHAEDLGAIYTDNTYTANAFSGNYWMDGGAATLTAMAAPNASKYQTNWFYESNRTAYHFRSLNSTAYGTDGDNLITDSNTDSNVTEDDKTSFKMASGADVDYHWGAPMNTGATLKYDETITSGVGNGFKANIYKGITSNTSDIKMTELHMMSSIKVILKTKGDGSYINLKDATVTFTQITKNATVDLGTGYITDAYNSSDATQLITSPNFTSWTDRTLNDDGSFKSGSIETGAYTWQFVPQPLVRKETSPADGDYVGITIHTTDNNEYFIVKQLSAITATSVTDERNQAKDAVIKRWYPGHQYTYTFTITKKGIDAITATVANWVNVTGDNVDLDLEK